MIPSEALTQSNFREALLSGFDAWMKSGIGRPHSGVFSKFPESLDILAETIVGRGGKTHDIRVLNKMFDYFIEAYDQGVGFTRMNYTYHGPEAKSRQIYDALHTFTINALKTWEIDTDEAKSISACEGLFQLTFPDFEPSRIDRIMWRIRYRSGNMTGYFPSEMPGDEVLSYIRKNIDVLVKEI